jgi:hypothetical protein
MDMSGQLHSPPAALSGKVSWLFAEFYLDGPQSRYGLYGERKIGDPRRESDTVIEVSSKIWLCIGFCMYFAL